MTAEVDSAGQTQAPAPRASAQAASRGNSNAALTDIRPGEEPAMVIKRQAEAGLARISLDQLTTVRPGNPKGALWTMEIPIRDGNQAIIARLTIEKDQQQASEIAQQGTAWAVVLEFDLPELGPIHARLRLSSDILDTRLWAERTDTMELMHDLSEVLRQRLTQAGFAEASVALYPGKPDSARNETAIRDLIDLKA